MQQLENFFRETGMGTTLVVLLVGVVFLIVIIYSLTGLIRRKIILRKVQAEIEEEELRVASLPGLHTCWLMKIPEVVANDLYGTNRNSFARSFGTRYNRLVVFDELGDPWVGLLMRETIMSLRECEYVQDNFCVPFCGPGEKYHGEPMTVEGIRITTYPKWITTGIDTAELKLWATFEKAYYQAKCNYNNDFLALFYPHCKKFNEKRQKLIQLRAQAANLTKKRLLT